MITLWSIDFSSQVDDSQKRDIRKENNILLMRPIKNFRDIY